MNTPNSAHYSIKSAFIKVLATLFIINENTIFFIVLDPKKLNPRLYCFTLSISNFNSAVSFS